MLRHALMILASVSVLHAQIAPPAPPVPPKPESNEPDGLVTLRSLVDAMSALRAQLDSANAKLKATDNEAAKEAAKKDVAELQSRLEQAQDDFESVATGNAATDYDDDPSDAKLDIGSELNELVEPLIHELKAATEQPRTIERLRTELEAEEKRVSMAKRAVENAEAMLKGLPKSKDPTPADIAVRKSLQATLDKWRNNLRETQGGVDVLRYKLADNLAKRKSIIELLSGAVAKFLLTRGRNIALAVLVFMLTFFGWRALQSWVLHFLPWKANDPSRPILARLLAVVLHVFSFIAATLSVLTTLYWAGDWLLLGLCLIALLALLIAAKSGLPKYFRQARLLMNFGEVREGERVMINGIPWLVKSINMFTELVNPTLQHATMRLPITQLVGMTSHPHGHDDPWFPCKHEDWVLLDDGTFGKAVSLTADFVQLVQLGGAFRTYTTQRFLQENPITLSGGFRVPTVVKLDRTLQENSTTTVPDALREGIHEALLELVEPAHIKSLRVEFRGVAGAWLEFDVIADFAGEVADKFGTLQRVLQRGALAVCNQRGWKVGG